MWRHRSPLSLPPLFRLLILFAILTIPVLAGRVMSYLKGEAPTGAAPSGSARAEVAKRF